MKPKKAKTQALLIPHPIRVETALSRYPIHTLDKQKATSPESAKNGKVRKDNQPTEINIELIEKVGDEETQIKWRVTYNASFGQPGPVAYKTDSLVINRKIEEARERSERRGEDFPDFIQIGSLRDIAEILRLGGDTSRVKLAFRQNASAFIVAKIRYKVKGETVRKLEANFNRYSVVFTGEKLPDGTDANGVYIIFNSVYRKILSEAETRPIDYNYLSILPPTPQRFYELLSYPMHGSLRHDRHRAKLAYSEFCTYAPQTRYYEWEKVRKQMAKVHAIHKKHGYIVKFEYEPIRDSEGKADWLLFYTPGPKAFEEFKAFNKRHEPAALEEKHDEPESKSLEEQIQLDFSLSSRLPAPKRSKPAVRMELPPLGKELVNRGASEKTACELVQEFEASYLESKIEEFDWRMRQPKPPEKPAGYLVTSIREHYGVDPKFVSAAESLRRREAQAEKERAVTEERRRQRQQEAAEKAEMKKVNDYWASLTPTQQAELDAVSIAAADPATLANETGPFRASLQRIRREAYIRLLLASHDQSENA